MRSAIRTCLLALLVAALSACGGPAPDPAAATQRFLAERNSGSADVGASRQFLGTITGLDGAMITLRTPLGGTVDVQLNEATRIRRQREAGLEDLAAGMMITAVGTEQNSALLAERVQIGEGGMLGATVMQIGAANGGAAPTVDVAPSAGAGPVGKGTVVSGTVAASDGRTLRIELADGAETTVRLADSAVVTREEVVPPGELQLDMFVSVTGSMQGDSLVAAMFEILPPPQSP